VADVNTDLGGYKLQALLVSGAWPWFLPGLSGDFLNQHEVWPQDWLSSMLISWNRHTLRAFCED